MKQVLIRRKAGEGDCSRLLSTSLCQALSLMGQRAVLCEVVEAQRSAGTHLWLHSQSVTPEQPVTCARHWLPPAYWALGAEVSARS